jgi:hypothetical protein
MVQGWHPDTNRAFVPPKLGITLSQPTHTDAPFSAEMVDGWLPDRQRYTAPQHPGEQRWIVEVEAFSIEMVIGSKPDTHRVRLGPKIPLPQSQPTHVPAAFSPDMAAGVIPPTKRYGAPFHTGGQWWISDVDAFSIDMIVGYHPDQGADRPRATDCVATRTDARRSPRP